MDISGTFGDFLLFSLHFAPKRKGSAQKFIILPHSGPRHKWNVGPLVSSVVFVLHGNLAEDYLHS